MTLPFATALTLVLVSAAAGQRPTTNAHEKSLPSTDSALVSYAGIVAFERLSYRISDAAQSSATSWWTFTFPDSTVPQMWAALRTHLMLAVRGRDSLATDSTKSFVNVFGVETVGDTLRFWMDIGGAYRCPEHWYGNSMGYRVQAVRSNGTWMHPPKSVPSVDSYSSGCAAPKPD